MSESKMKIIARSDALLMFGKWRDEGLTVSANGFVLFGTPTIALGVQVEGKVASVDESAIRISTDDSYIGIPLQDVRFSYVEAHSIPKEAFDAAGARFVCCLRVDREAEDMTFFLIELRESE